MNSAAGATHASKVIFWSAGATAALGIRTTKDQEAFIQKLTSDSCSIELEKRVTDALGMNNTVRWNSALADLIDILGDEPANYDRIDEITDHQLAAMRRNWGDSEDDEIKRRIIYLRSIYDWPALKSIVRISPGSSGNGFRLNDLFNLLDLHIPSGFGVRAPTHPAEFSLGNPDARFLDSRRLIGAKNALRLMLVAMFYIDWQECIRRNRDLLDTYYHFAEALGRRIQGNGIVVAAMPDQRLDEPTFYRGDVAFISLNYDPIGLWVQFIANRDLNKFGSPPYVGRPPGPIQLFNDFGHLIPARRINKPSAGFAWYPMNEGAVQRLNELQIAGTERVRLTKFLFPHGSLCWRECPDCRKLSAYHGDEWAVGTCSLFPPPPLLAFDNGKIPVWIEGEERIQREKGAIDARACLHCGTLNYSVHTQMVMQSSFKSPPPSFIEEIQREVRATTTQAKHIIFMGYSLPLDDVSYRALLAATCQQRPGDNVKCTIVGLQDAHDRWFRNFELNAADFQNNQTVRAAIDIFGQDHVRYYGGGVPDVFLDNGTVTDAKLKQLLDWS